MERGNPAEDDSVVPTDDADLGKFLVSHSTTLARISLPRSTRSPSPVAPWLAEPVGHLVAGRVQRRSLLQASPGF